MLVAIPYSLPPQNPENFQLPKSFWEIGFLGILGGDQNEFLGADPEFLGGIVNILYYLYIIPKNFIKIPKNNNLFR